MDDAHEVRAELRNYALRRCIRFYTGILVYFFASALALVAPSASGEAILRSGAGLLALLAGVEVASFVAMRDIAAARDRFAPGPETPLWRFAQGHWPCLLAAGIYLLGAGLLVA